MRGIQNSAKEQGPTSCLLRRPTLCLWNTFFSNKSISYLKQKEQGSIRTFSYYNYYQWGKYFPETPRRHFLMSDGGHILHLWPNHWLEIRITWIGLGQSQISQDKGGANVAHHGGLPIWSATKGGGNLYSKGSGMIMGDIQVELKIHYILRWFHFHNPLDSSAYMSLHLSLYFENFLSDIKKAKVRLKA